MNQVSKARRGAMFGVLALCCGLLGAVNSAAEPFNMATGATEPLAKNDGGGFLNLIADEAFGRLGLEVVVEALPPARAIQQADDGRSDGDMQRISGIEASFPNLVRVGEKINDYRFVAFSSPNNMSEDGEPGIEINGWESLTGYRVGYLRGWKFYETNIPVEIETVIADNPRQLMSLLDYGRVDLILFSQWEGLWWGRETGVPVTMLEPPLGSMEMFAYVNRVHAELAPQLANALRDMKDDGTYRRIAEQSLFPLLED